MHAKDRGYRRAATARVRPDELHLVGGWEASRRPRHSSGVLSTRGRAKRAGSVDRVRRDGMRDSGESPERPTGGRATPLLRHPPPPSPTRRRRAPPFGRRPPPASSRCSCGTVPTHHPVDIYYSRFAIYVKFANFWRFAPLRFVLSGRNEPAARRADGEFIRRFDTFDKECPECNREARAGPSGVARLPALRASKRASRPKGGWRVSYGGARRPFGRRTPPRPSSLKFDQNANSTS